MLDRWLHTGWNDLSPFEQGVVLAQLELRGQKAARRQFDEAQEKGTPVPVVDCWTYLDEVGDNPSSPWLPWNSFEKLLDPRVSTFCIAMERERRGLMGLDPFPTQQEDILRLGQQASSLSNGDEDYALFTIALMTLNA